MMPRAVQELLWWNPVLHLVGLMRRGVYGIYPADYVSTGYVMALSLGLLLLGLLLLRGAIATCWSSSPASACRSPRAGSRSRGPFPPR